MHVLYGWSTWSGPPESPCKYDIYELMQTFCCCFFFFLNQMIWFACTYLAHVFFRHTRPSTELCTRNDTIFKLRWMRFGIIQLSTFIIWIQFEYDFHKNIGSFRSIIRLSPAGSNCLFCTCAVCFGQTRWTNPLIKLYRTNHLNESNVIIFFRFNVRRMWNCLSYVNINDWRIVTLCATIIFTKPNKSRWTTVNRNEIWMYKFLFLIDRFAGHLHQTSGKNAMRCC